MSPSKIAPKSASIATMRKERLETTTMGEQTVAVDAGLKPGINIGLYRLQCGSDAAICRRDGVCSERPCSIDDHSIMIPMSLE